MEAGGPVHAAAELALGEDAKVVEYVPGDLTITTLAGTSLAQIAEVVSRENQWLALDPLGDSRGTIGATIATASFGPLAHAFGTPRDQLLGVEFVDGSGDVIRGGGRVTKNVAGFDLARLVCGAWGTLGVITEVTLRLRARPERDVIMGVPVPDNITAGDLAGTLAVIRQSGVAPLAFELVNGSMCSAAGVEMDGAMLLRFAGNEAGVASQIRRLTAVVGAEQCEPGVWERIRRTDRFDHMSFRVSARPARITDLWSFAQTIAARLSGCRLSASAGRGVVRFSVPFQHENAVGALLRARPESALICERLPAALWPELAPSSGLADKLTTRTRDVFDPLRILNPGVLGEAA
jgi:glycolate oxidase FAD binding subunit